MILRSDVERLIVLNGGDTPGGELSWMVELLFNGSPHMEIERAELAVAILRRAFVGISGALDMANGRAAKREHMQ